jgi:prepilin-type N-terminal cleavage/methylation domain-containing protein
MRIRTALTRARRRLRRADGYTLIELVVVMTILALVMTPLVMNFATGMRQEVDQTRREEAYANARLALQRLRVDIHCATGTPGVAQNAYGGFTLTLQENNDISGGSGWCPSVLPAGSGVSGVQWCTIPYTGSTTRFVLYRYLGTTSLECDGGSGSSFEVDYLAATPGIWPTNANAVDTLGNPLDVTNQSLWVGNLWPTAATCATGHLRTVSIDFNVAIDPVNYPNEHYELKDAIGLRNATRCP